MGTGKMRVIQCNTLESVLFTLSPLHIQVIGRGDGGNTSLGHYMIYNLTVLFYVTVCAQALEV